MDGFTQYLIDKIAEVEMALDALTEVMARVRLDIPRPAPEAPVAVAPLTRLSEQLRLDNLNEFDGRSAALKGYNEAALRMETALFDYYYNDAKAQGVPNDLSKTHSCGRVNKISQVKS